MNPLLQILAIVTPIVVDGIAKIRAERATANLPEPTPGEMESLLLEHYRLNIDTILAKGRAWTDAHPVPPKDTP